MAEMVAVRLPEGCNAVLLANHGVVVTGGSLDEALHRSVEVERLAQLFIWAETLGGAVPLDEWTVRMSSIGNPPALPGDSQIMRSP